MDYLDLPLSLARVALASLICFWCSSLSLIALAFFSSSVALWAGVCFVLGIGLVTLSSMEPHTDKLSAKLFFDKNSLGGVSGSYPHF